ncbi:YlbG family protein [Lentilactobacillus sp. Marseille-Q4993]|uniref:YlbG family protein n=1 Tax=Lentilactobacillus sp. Marseille-Q4993 TaxID=3039492 RepID=UPI0024BC5692|nr:YlbG family protein [Lentilactobacillus sp. Marseille-Q4993]
MDTEIPEGVGLIVYIYSPRQLRNLKQFGKTVYYSKRLRYAVLYVDSDNIDETIKKIESRRFVKEVIRSKFPELLKTVNESKLGNAKQENDLGV